MCLAREIQSCLPVVAVIGKEQRDGSAEGLCVVLIGSVCVDWRDYWPREGTIGKSNDWLCLSVCLSVHLYLVVSIRQSRSVFAGTVSELSLHLLLLLLLGLSVVSESVSGCKSISGHGWHRSIGGALIYS